MNEEPEPELVPSWGPEWPTTTANLSPAESGEIRMRSVLISDRLNYVRGLLKLAGRGERPMWKSIDDVIKWLTWHESALLRRQSEDSAFVDSIGESRSTR